jgi:hypothetical protein
VASQKSPAVTEGSIFIHQDKRLQYFGLARLSPLRADSFFFREKEAKTLGCAGV